MHKNTKLPPAMRKEIFQVWKKEKCSHRELGIRYHVDKRVIGRIIERGKQGDFSVHSSINKRYSEDEPKASTSTDSKSASRARVAGGKQATRKRIKRG